MCFSPHWPGVSPDLAWSWYEGRQTGRRGVDVSFRCRGPAASRAPPSQRVLSHGDTGLSETASCGPWCGRWRRVVRPRLGDTWVCRGCPGPQHRLSLCPSACCCWDLRSCCGEGRERGLVGSDAGGRPPSVRGRSRHAPVSTRERAPRARPPPGGGREGVGRSLPGGAEGRAHACLHRHTAWRLL